MHGPPNSFTEIGDGSTGGSEEKDDAAHEEDKPQEDDVAEVGVRTFSFDWRLIKAF
jgi:hypothetical protein